jgi:biopolymer transport protein ExbD
MAKLKGKILPDRQKKKPELDMAPMIDCVFQLLIFFMLTTSFAPLPGIRVQLPPPSSKPTTEKPKGAILRIANPEGVQRDGTMVLGIAGIDEIVDYNEIFSRLINSPEEMKNMLIIQSERQVLHQQIVKVMDLAKQAGMDKIGFAMVARE